MIIQPLQGKLSCNNFFIYAACDEKYFDEFGKVLVNSIRKNSSDDIHIHIFNPRQDQIEFCQNQNISLTYEYAPLELFTAAAERWNTVPTDPVEKHNYDRILTSMSKGGDKSIAERIQKTYFACARFIRLAELVTSSNTAFSIDVDAVVRANIPRLGSDYDFFLHHITGKKARFLAGGMYINPTGQTFLNEYAAVLKQYIANDDIHWGLDQDVLDPIVPKYKFGGLPMTYIDWNMHPSSYIWTAKGTRKELQSFIDEQKKYMS